MKKAILVMMVLGMAIQTQAKAKSQKIDGAKAIQVIRESFLGNNDGIEQGETDAGTSCSVTLNDDGDSLKIVVSVDGNAAQTLVFSAEDSYKYLNDEDSDGSYKRTISNKYQTIQLITMDDAYEMLETIVDGKSISCDVYF